MTDDIYVDGAHYGWKGEAVLYNSSNDDGKSLKTEPIDITTNIIKIVAV